MTCVIQWATHWVDYGGGFTLTGVTVYKFGCKGFRRVIKRGWRA